MDHEKSGDAKKKTEPKETSKKTKDTIRNEPAENAQNSLGGLRSEQVLSKDFLTRKRSLFGSTEDKELPEKQSSKPDESQERKGTVASLRDILKIPVSSNSHNAETEHSSASSGNSPRGNENSSQRSSKWTISKVPSWLSQHFPSRQKQTEKTSKKVQDGKPEEAFKNVEVDGSTSKTTPGSGHVHWNWWFNPNMTTSTKDKIDSAAKKTDIRHNRNAEPTAEQIKPDPDKSKNTVSGFKKNQHNMTKFEGQVPKSDPDQSRNKVTEKSSGPSLSSEKNQHREMTRKPSGGDRAQSTISKWYSFRYHHKKPVSRTEPVVSSSGKEQQPEKETSAKGNLEGQAKRRWQLFRHSVPRTEHNKTSTRSASSGSNNERKIVADKSVIETQNKSENEVSGPDTNKTTESGFKKNQQVPTITSKEKTDSKSTGLLTSKWMLIKQRLSKSDTNLNTTVPGSEKKPNGSKKKEKTLDSAS